MREEVTYLPISALDSNQLEKIWIKATSDSSTKLAKAMREELQHWGVVYDIISPTTSLVYSNILRFVDYQCL